MSTKSSCAIGALTIALDLGDYTILERQRCLCSLHLFLLLHFIWCSAVLMRERVRHVRRLRVEMRLALQALSSHFACGSICSKSAKESAEQSTETSQIICTHAASIDDTLLEKDQCGTYMGSSYHRPRDLPWGQC